MTKTLDAWGSKEIKISDKLLKEFGLKPFTGELLRTDNYLLHRGVIVAHRDFERVAQAAAAGKPFLQVTGVATSGELHLGHKVDIDVFLMLREIGARSFFCVCDIDAYVSRPDEKVPSMAKAKEYAVTTVAHLLAFGVKPEEIYVQSRKEPRYYEFTFELSKKITENTFKGIYGHLDLGKLSANLLQYADILHQQLPEYAGPMPSVTAIGVEQDPHARAARDLVKRLAYKKMVPPSFLYFKHQGGLQEGAKMSSSEPETAIFLTDSPEQVKRKLDRAYSGGRDSVEEHRRLGGVPEKDKAFEILLFHHPDNDYVEDVYKRYRSGEMLSGELKKLVREFLVEMLSEHQRKMKQHEATARRIVYGE
jgi:tryptophanyl-tRNA synthetase